MNPLAPALLIGTVMHRRPSGPLAFTYPLAALQIPLSQLATDAAALAPLPIDRFGIWSFYRRDHGPRDGSELLPWIRAQLVAHGLAGADGEVILQCFPRTLGWGFNPVSFWFCHGAAGELVSVLAEVRNTFGERHNYLLGHADGRAIVAGDELHAAKVFHVSPFFDRAGGYRFRFTGYGGAGSPACRVEIDYLGPEGLRLETAIGGLRQPLDAPHLAAARRRYPWQTLATLFRIHHHAARLWRRGIAFHRKPAPPLLETTR